MFSCKISQNIRINRHLGYNIMVFVGKVAAVLTLPSLA
jgi:hypothetical protein